MIRSALVVWMLLLLLIRPAAGVEANLEIQRLGRGSADCVAWSPTDDVLAVAGDEGIWLYDSNLEDIASLSVDLRHPCLTWSPNDQLLAVNDSGYDEPSSSIYEVSADGLHEILTDLPDKRSATWTPDGKHLLITTSSDLDLIDTETFDREMVFPGTASYALSPSNRYMAIALEAQVEIYDLVNKDITITLPNAEDRVTQIAWSPNGEKIAAASKNRIDVFDLGTGNVLYTKSTEVKNEWSEFEPYSATLREPIGPMLWKVDNRTLIVVNKHPVIAGFDTLRVWDTESDSLVFEERLNSGCSQLAWSVNGNLLLLRGIAGSLYPYSRAYNVSDWQVVETGLNDGTWDLSPNKDYYLTGTFRSDEISLLRGSDLSVVKTFDTVANLPSSWSWNHDGTKFASAHLDEVQVWNVDSGERIARRVDYIHPLYHGPIRWSPNGTMVAYVSDGLGFRHTYNQANLRIWNTETHTVALNRPGLTGPIFWITYELDWSPDGQHFLLASSSSVRMYDTQSGEVTRTYLEAEDPYSYVASDVSWSRENHEIAVLQRPTSGANIQIINDENGEVTRSLPANDAQEIQWRPNSRFLTVLNQDHWYLLNVDSLDRPLEMASTTDARPFLFWSPDGRYLARLDGQMLRVWEIADNGTDARVVFQQATTSRVIAWHPDSQHLALASGTNITMVDVSSDTVGDTIEVPGKTSDASQINTMAWNPQGTALALFIEYRSNLYILPLSSGSFIQSHD